MFSLNFRTHQFTSTLLIVTILLLVPLGRGSVVRAQTAVLHASPVNTIATSAWTTPSPDPSGITYWPDHNTLLIVDGEVDEMQQYFTGKNVFETTLGGTLTATYSTMSFTNEPVGIDIDIGPNGHFFISMDTKKKVFDIDLGGDKKFGTADDKVRSFSTSVFGDNDPEGIAFGQGKLFLTDGAGKKVYQVDPGPNGLFEGTGDDTVTSFSTTNLGQTDPEGVEYNPDTGHLYLISNDKNSDVAEVTIDGTLVRVIDVSFLGLVSPADLTFAPSSQNQAVNNLYIVDRGIDNNVDPNENDGKVFELSLHTGSNLLINGDFENDANGDSKPDGWSAHNSFTRSTGDGVVIPRSDSYVGKHAATDDSGYTISQTINNLTAGTAYTFSGWVNIPATSDAFTFKLQVQWRNASNGTISTALLKKYTAATSGWNQVTYSQLAPAGTTNARVQMVVSSLNATIYVDDFDFGP